MAGVLWAVVSRQFGRPSGLLGSLAGAIMSRRTSNRERNRRTLDLLGLEPGDRVLEIGFGPGLAIEEAARRIPDGRIVGVDHSAVMLRQAAKRNAAALAAGRVELHLGSVGELPAQARLFDRALAINVHQFWSDPVATLRRAAALLRPGGRIAITLQPRHPGATDQDAVRAGKRIAAHLGAAGFEEPICELIPLKPVIGACVLARRPR